MMQLVILSIVTVPMLMLMQLQKHNLVQTRESLMNRLAADQMFDNDMVPFLTQVSGWSDGTNNYLHSTLCDPIQHNKTDDEYSKTCCWAKVMSLPAGAAHDAALATCPDADHPYNRDLWKGPFFKRTYTDSAGGRILQTKVELFKEVENNSTANPPYYAATRTYNIDVSNTDYGMSYNYFSGLTPSQYSAKMQIDEEGNLWQPAAWAANPPGMTTSNPLLPRPYRSFLSYSGTVTTHGFTLPNTVYLFNAYFVSPATPTPGCFNNTTGTSCSSVTILMYSSTLPMSDSRVPNLANADYKNSLTLLKTLNNIDLATLANIDEPGQKPIVLSMNFRTPPDAQSFLLKVIPTPPDAGQTNTMQYSGMSFIRYKEQ